MFVQRYPSPAQGVLLVVLLVSVLPAITPNIVTQPGTIPFGYACWPFKSNQERMRVFTQQRQNQRNVYRTAESMWCTHSQLGTVAGLEWGADYGLIDSDANATLVRVSWLNGVTGVHRMGLQGHYDLDILGSVNSAVLSNYTFEQLNATLTPGTTVTPTVVVRSDGSNDWLAACNAGFASQTKAQGQYSWYNANSKMAMVQWSPLDYNAPPFYVFHRYSETAVDFCFSGCADFSQFTLADFGAMFAKCPGMVPSPSLLAEDPLGFPESITTGIPPHYVGFVPDAYLVGPIEGSVYMRPSYDDPVIYIDLLAPGICLNGESTCPNWGEMKMADAAVLLANRTSIGRRGEYWSGIVVRPPGYIWSKARAPFPGFPGSLPMQGAMGANGTYDYCFDDFAPDQYSSNCPNFGPPTTTMVTTEFYYPTDSSSSSNDTFTITSAPSLGADQSYCPYPLVTYFYSVFVPLAAVCVVYLLFRDPQRPFRFTTRPSVPIPVNPLNYRVDRFLVAVTFGATVQIVYLMWTGELGIHISTSSNTIAKKWLAAVASILMMLLIGFSFFTMFVGITTSHQPEGVIMGFVFSVLFIVFYTLRLASCPHSGLAVAIFQATPAFFCLGLMLVYFFLRFFRYVAASMRQESMASFADKYQFGKAKARELNYLKDLLNREREKLKQATIEEDGKKKSLASRLTRIVLSWLKYNFPIPQRKDSFSYSPLYLSCIVMGILGVYMIIVSLVPLFVFFVSTLGHLSTGNTLPTAFGVNLNEVLKDVNAIFPASGMVALILASFMVLFHCLHMLRTYKRHMQRLYRGDTSFMAPLATPVVQLGGYARLLGLQVGYVLLGFAIMFLVLFLITWVIAIAILLLKYIPILRTIFISYVITPLAVVIVVMILTRIITMLALDKENSGKYPVISRRGLYFNIVYFFTFYNVIVGLMAFILRMGMITALNTVLLLRLNRTLMPRGWAKWDFGFAAYCSFLRVELAHTHPVMLAFVTLTRDAASRHQSMRATQAAKRWHLAYTLVQNPILLPLRKHAITKSDWRTTSMTMVTALNHAKKTRAASPTAINSTAEDIEYRSVGRPESRFIAGFPSSGANDSRELLSPM